LIKCGDIREEERCHRVLIDALKTREEESNERSYRALKGRRKSPD